MFELKIWRNYNSTITYYCNYFLNAPIFFLTLSRVCHDNHGGTLRLLKKSKMLTIYSNLLLKIIWRKMASARTLDVSLKGKRRENVAISLKCAICVCSRSGESMEHGKWEVASVRHVDKGRWRVGAKEGGKKNKKQWRPNSKSINEPEWSERGRNTEGWRKKEAERAEAEDDWCSQKADFLLHLICITLQSAHTHAAINTHTHTHTPQSRRRLPRSDTVIRYALWILRSGARARAPFDGVK